MSTINLDQLDLKPGMTLLEIGCGWGLTLQRAMEKYDVNVIGLTLSKNQKAYCDQLLAKVDSDRTFDVRLKGWEQFHSPVDRIVSIEAIEHFGFERYRRLLQELLRHPARRRPDDDPEQRAATTRSIWPTAARS